MIWRPLLWPTQVALIALAICGFLLAGQFAPAQAQQPVCAVDLDGNGDAGDPGEVVSCSAMADDAWLCPVQQVMCVADAQGEYFQISVAFEHAGELLAGHGDISFDDNLNGIIA